MFANVSWVIILAGWIFWIVVIGVIVWALVKALRKKKSSELDDYPKDPFGDENLEDEQDLNNSDNISKNELKKEKSDSDLS